MEPVELLRSTAQVAATLVEGIGVVVVAVAVVRAVAHYLRLLVRRSQPFPPDALRLELGRSLALALELLLGADILRTAVEPTWEEISRLAAIAAIRIALNFFLQRELAAEERRVGNRDGADQPASATTDRGTDEDATRL